VIFEKNLSGARPIEAPLGKRQDALLGIKFDLHQLLLLQKSYKVDAGGAGGRALCENRRYRALNDAKTRKTPQKIIQNRRLFGVGFVLPN
jgi:hypothetical protein